MGSEPGRPVTVGKLAAYGSSSQYTKILRGVSGTSLPGDKSLVLPLRRFAHR